MYHSPADAARDEKNHFKQRLFWGDLVLYHRSNAPGPPFFDIGIPAAEVAGITFRPAVLGEDLARFPAAVSPAGLLPGSHSRIGMIVSTTELALFEHPGPPPAIAVEVILPGELKKQKSAALLNLQPHPLRHHQCPSWYPFDCRLHTAGCATSWRRGWIG